MLHFEEIVLSICRTAGHMSWWKGFLDELNVIWSVALLCFISRAVITKSLSLLLASFKASSFCGFIKSSGKREGKQCRIFSGNNNSKFFLPSTFCEDKHGYHPFFTFLFLFQSRHLVPVKASFRKTQERGMKLSE